MTQVKGRLPGKHYCKLNLNARQRKGSNQSEKTAKHHSKNPEQKIAFKTRTLFVLEKTQIQCKQRTEKGKHQVYTKKIAKHPQNKPQTPKRASQR